MTAGSDCVTSAKLKNTIPTKDGVSTQCRIRSTVHYNVALTTACVIATDGVTLTLTPATSMAKDVVLVWTVFTLLNAAV